MSVELETVIKQLCEPIPVSQFNKRNLEEEFEILRYLSSRDKAMSNLATRSKYKALNRYSDVLAFKHNIVKLDNEELSEHNYINANYVDNHLTGKKGDNLILTQGPLVNTTDHFWQMVDKENSEMIICIIEKNKFGMKCHKYWPDKKMDTKNHVINTKPQEDNSLFIRRMIELKSLKSDKDLAIDHYHFYNWVDFSTLSEKDTEEFLQFIKDMYKKKQESKSPIVIHCSAGIGRSGTLAAVFNIYDHWVMSKEKKQEFKVSIFDVVRVLRTQRFGAVQTFQQYRFIYSMVKKFK